MEDDRSGQKKNRTTENDTRQRTEDRTTKGKDQDDEEDEEGRSDRGQETEDGRDRTIQDRGQMTKQNRR